MTLFLFSRPPMTRSTASSKSLIVTAVLSVRAAMSAASLHTLAMSAPAKPGVRAAMRSEKNSTGSDNFSFARYTRKICSRPLMSGRSIVIWRSKRPGRRRALSSMSGLLVPARTTVPVVVAKPSISTRSWLRVFSRSSFPPAKPPRPRARPMASISSMKMIDGDWARAWAKRSLTLAGPTPTNISMKSEPLMERNGTPASPAVALARRVFPVPGGPTRRAPFGILAPSSW
mmetsp:Transcript_11010/g.31097  ORF Transcript_11010/g.31097 Transcript_11010/m.31097 type:complete len:230 (+) Transcript_11010:1094-1783(+)